MKYIGILLSCMILIFLASCTGGSNEPNSGEMNTSITINDTDMNEENTISENTEELSDAQQNTLDISVLQTEENYSFTTDSGIPVVVWPISHATMIIEWGEDILYIDPAEEMSAYEGYPLPNYVFVTHEHGDHYNPEVLEQLVGEGVELVVNPSVNELLPESLSGTALVLSNGESQSMDTLSIEAIPAYNIREEALNYHPQGRDNGYLLETDGFRMYISGDTEDTPEMRSLSDIDVAFVSMNLPYTMPIENAADGVLAFASKTVIPYHFRGTDGLSNVAYFRELVQAENSDINVILHNWYTE